MMKQFSLQYISSFCMSLHLAMQAGIAVSEGVSLFEQEEPDASRRGTIHIIYSALDIGESLSKGIRDTGAFPDYMMDMIEVGEKTGKLDETLLSLSRYYDRQVQMSKSIRSAVTYPAMLLGVLLLVLVIFIVKVLPIFYDVYQQLGAKMSGFATGAMRFGIWLGNNWIPIVIVVAVLAICAVLFHKKLAKAISNLFMSGSLGKSMMSARFSGIMAMTMSSGMDMFEAFTMAARLTEDKAMAAKIQDSAKQVAQGASFSQCISDIGILPTLYNRMISIGVKTGSADKVMEELATRTGDDANDRLESFVGKIEPTLVIVMSVLVGLLLLSVMLPLAGIMSAV